MHIITCRNKGGKDLKGTTHIIGGAIAGNIIANCFNLPVEETIMITTASAIGGLIPDIDKRQSTIGKRLFFISIPVSKIFGHRTFTHSLLPYMLILYLLNIFKEAISYHFVWQGLIIGALSHIALDMLNPHGVSLFYPYKKKISILKIKTGSSLESIFTIFMILGYSVTKFI